MDGGTFKTVVLWLLEQYSNGLTFIDQTINTFGSRRKYQHFTNDYLTLFKIPYK